MTQHDREQLEFIVRCNPTFLIRHIKEATNYDAKMLEVVFELAKEKAHAALASSDAQADGGKGEAIYQTQMVGNAWADVSREEYERTLKRFPQWARVIYTAQLAECNGEAVAAIAYQTGTPPKTGIYACRVPFDAMERPENNRLMRDEFLLWYDGRWSYCGSDQIYRGTVLGWIGPLPRPIFDVSKEKSNG
jgi:hypothetical protein